MKKIIKIIIWVFIFTLTVLNPQYSYSEEEGFEAKQEKIKVNKVAREVLNVETVTIKEVEVDEKIRTTGQIEEMPVNHFDINTPVQGTVAQVLVTLGDKISAGQAVAIIESPEVARLEAEIKQLEAELELAQNNFEREKSLFEKGLTSKKDFETSKTLLKSIEAKLTAASSNLKIFTGLSEPDEGGTFSIRARKSGTIVERNLTVGQIVSSNQLLFHGIDLSTVWASADIYERDLGQVKLGQKVFVTLDGIPDKVFEGKLTYIGSVINEGTRTLPVKATLINKEALLKPGAFLQLAIYTEKKKKSVVIPKTALMESEKEGSLGKHDHLVYIKNGDKFIPRKIQVESHDSDFVEVLSGLEAGEVIITNGAYQLQYGDGEKEDSSNGEHHKQDSKEQNNGIPIWWMIGIGLLGLIAGILIGKKK